MKPEAARPGHEDQVKAEIAARVKQREPALEALAKLTADLFVSPLQREAARAELLDLLQRAKVADDPGRRRLCRAGPRTRRVGIIDKIKYPYLAVERQAFDSWGQQYLRHEALTMK